jgi:hypothetical protein
MPNMTQNIPPTTGCGMIMKTAPNLLIRPWISIKTAAYWITRRLPIFIRRLQHKYDEFEYIDI